MATGTAQQQPRGSFPYIDRPIPIRERVRLAGYAVRRAAWRVHYQHPRFDTPPHEPILVVFGMHRSGTSAAVGILEELGFKVPGTLPPDGTGDNKRGTREPIELTSLTNNVLQVNNSSWREPPSGPVRYSRSHIVQRNNLIQQCTKGQHVLKDPRMLLMPDLWSGLSINAIAVVRNPVDVAASLLRRGEPLTQPQAINLWKAYNRALLHYVEHHNCPIALFDMPGFADQIASCIQRHDPVDLRFFEDQFVRSRTQAWRELIDDNEVVTLYDRLARSATASRSPQSAAAPVGEHSKCNA